MTDNQIGDGPVEPAYVQMMNRVAQVVDFALNGEAAADERSTGFALLVFPFGTASGRCNYISNAQRDDVLKMLKQQVEQFENEAQR